MPCLQGSRVIAPVAAGAQLPRVLIVDDDSNVIAALHALLGRDCTLRAARNGIDALRLAREEPPELVLLDIEMPGMDGIEVCRHLKADPRLVDVPVIFLTRHEAAETQVEGLAAGAVDFIVKPPRGPVVLARIRTHLRLTQMSQALRAAALTDSLTGVGNRRVWDQTLPREWLRCLRAGAPLSVMMIDVDHFKAYNDKHGHILGDTCLRAVARALQSCVQRQADLLARYGGEEFAVLLPGTDRAGAMAQATRMLQALTLANLPHGASPVGPQVTVSIGLASFDAHCAAWLHRPDDSQPQMLAALGLPELMLAADAALYRAKQAGRARIEFIAAGDIIAADGVIADLSLSAVTLDAQP